MLSLELGFPVFELYCGELAPQYPDDEIAAAAGGLKKTGVDTLSLTFDEVEHGLDRPLWSEDLSMVYYTLFRFY